MPINGMNVGRDYNFGLFDPLTSALVELGDVETVDVKPMKHEISSRPYNDVPKFGFIPDGYQGTFTITRTGSQLEDLQLALNEAFNAGQIIRAGYLNETVTDPDGTVAKYQYQGCVFHVDDLGQISREKTVKQKVEFKASRKIKLA